MDKKKVIFENYYHVIMKASHANLLIYSAQLINADSDLCCSPHSFNITVTLLVEKPSRELFLLI